MRFICGKVLVAAHVPIPCAGSCPFHARVLFFGTERVVERPLQAPGGTFPGLVSVQERGIICVPLWFASASTPVLRRLTRMAAACRIHAIAAPVRHTCERILRRNPGNRPSIDAALRHSTKNKSWGLVWITLANFHNLNGIPPPRRVQAGPTSCLKHCYKLREL